MAQADRPTPGTARPGDIELRLSHVEGLFETLDPSPFRERDLDADCAAFILDWAQDLPETAALRLRLHLPAAEADRAADLGLAEAVARHFATLAHAAERDRRALFRDTRLYLAIGMGVLALCLLGSHLVRTRWGDGPVADLARESLLILGWVANWKPLETVLYDWWPIRRRLRLLRRLQAMPVTIDT